MAWRYFVLIVVLSTSFAGGVWMSHARDTRVCQIDLRSDAQKHLNAWRRTRRSQSCRTARWRPSRSVAYGCRMTTVRSWITFLTGRRLCKAAAATPTVLASYLRRMKRRLIKFMSRRLIFWSHLNFSNQAVDRLEAWYRQAHHGQAKSSALSLVKDAHRPAVTLAVARGTEDENLWRVVVEIRP